MYSIRIKKTLRHFNGEHAVIANDSARRCFLGVSRGHNEVGDFLFVEIDRVTLLELERGETDTSTALRDRCAGIVLRPTSRTNGRYRK